MKIETAKALYVVLNKVSVSGRENLQNLLAGINTVAQELEELAKEANGKRGNHDDTQHNSRAE